MTDSPLQTLHDSMILELDSALRRIADRVRQPSNGLWSMITYTLGWGGEGAGPDASGKRIRPLLCLLVCGASGTDWRAALSPACAVELLHSFSLVHDDVQDESSLRRGRPAVWAQYGAAHAINTGDSLFALAFSALSDISESADSMLRILGETCLQLTNGQYLDMAFEKMEGITLDQYQQMIGGKTAALIAASCRLGAVAARASSERQEAYSAFGRALGMAFQIQDDYLGIWGKPEATGKSTRSDLLNRKKSLPIVYGLSRSAIFRALLAGELTPESLPPLVAELEACGAREYTLVQAREWTEMAFSSLRGAAPSGECGAALEELAAKLLERKK